jgi:hypothetical protein
MITIVSEVHTIPTTTPLGYSSSLPCLSHLNTPAFSSPVYHTIHACTPQSRDGTHAFRNGKYIYTFRTIRRVWDAVYKHKPRNLVSNGILHAELQLPEYVGDVTAEGGLV